jgi:DNA-directed RNA polymerase alpha subunit
MSDLWNAWRQMAEARDAFLAAREAWERERERDEAITARAAAVFLRGDRAQLDLPEEILDRLEMFWRGEGLSTGAAKGLARLGLSSWDQVNQATDKTLLKAYNFGKTMLREVREEVRRRRMMG